MTDDVIDNGDKGNKTVTKEETAPPKKFSLSGNLQAFPTFVLELTVPNKKKGWRQKIQNVWASTREEFRDKKPGTQKLYISKFRKAVKDAIIAEEPNDDRAKLLLTEIVQGILVIEDDIQEAVLEEDKRRIEKYSTSLIVFTHWKELLDEFRLLLHHPEPRFIAIGLLALTGRRFGEILSTGKLDPVYQIVGSSKVIQRYEVAFYGQTKTRGAEGTLYNQTYRIPVNAEADEVINAFKRLRNSHEGAAWASMSSKELNSTPNKTLNRALQTRIGTLRAGTSRIWPEEYDGDLTVKILRAFYAEIAFHYHAEDEVTKGAYFSRILGHGADDYHSALSYMRFALKTKDVRAAQQEIERLKVLLREQKDALAHGDGKISN